MHVLKIHNVKIDYNALAMAMGNGELSLLFVRCRNAWRGKTSNIEHTSSFTPRRR